MGEVGGIERVGLQRRYERLAAGSGRIEMRILDRFT